MHGADNRPRRSLRMLMTFLHATPSLICMHLLVSLGMERLWKRPSRVAAPSMVERRHFGHVSVASVPAAQSSSCAGGAQLLDEARFWHKAATYGHRMNHAMKELYDPAVHDIYTFSTLSFHSGKGQNIPNDFLAFGRPNNVNNVSWRDGWLVRVSLGWAIVVVMGRRDGWLVWVGWAEGSGATEGGWHGRSAMQECSV
eukprot:232011-Chlamydomonas_euryale.AAC.3